MMMNLQPPCNSSALVVRDEKAASRGTGGVVLDALPYVEELDPDYEQYSLSLIGQELETVVSEAAQGQQSADGELEHPLMRQILPSGHKYAGTSDLSSSVPSFEGRAPLASAAYTALVRHRASGGDETRPKFEVRRPNPIAEDAPHSSPDDLVSNLEKSIRTRKIEHEQERIRYANLELFQQFETPSQFTSYNALLEDGYVKPMKVALDVQRLKVDGINATRMEEQQKSIVKIHQLNSKWYSLVDKNERLGRAIGGLEAEVEGLRKQAGVTSAVEDVMDET
ncbi:hypothetical protein THAOC_34880 [Thalassiosira oceanica]|uniref:Pre-mRNA-splicing factor SPF27 n=1 Tax=Thalassiosira oceanica TaxID=159749 RepID=K0RBI3_THAOC|nr:hypothetical protein THAOC_34880 [Thalassiosira oceanica]|mmetsp:Transcript_35761/g.85277  ORF Transcript_35761/g.85277 Transcript_35761/m.85277 type:complete len:281 (-) Transcript_35761:56-898(-)|eukprot:EJK46451.1 hypothetical protein THAOC_34880 [Thalassiosira oceanica]